MRYISIVFIILVLSMMVSSSAFADMDPQSADQPTPYEEIFAWLGKLGVMLGALSLSWFMMKRKRVSNVMSVRKTANLFYRMHKATGWSALVLVVIHGAYFIFFKWLETDTITGLLALMMLIMVTIYGVLLSRRRLPRARCIHFGLSLIWVLLTIIHAVDAIPFLLVVIGLSYGFIWWLERRVAKF
jgi:hypothetical protein